MTCEQVERDDIAERYLTNGLTPAEQQEFEEHYFGCDTCFTRLETLRLAQAALRSRPRRQRSWMTWSIPALAAALIIAISLWFYQGLYRAPKPALIPHQAIQPATDSYAELARFDPPRYAPLSVRGAETDSTRRFRDAMQHYSNGDYEAAAAGLRALINSNASDTRARFYLAACELLLDDAAHAAQDFQTVVNARDSDYLEEAHFALAKADLRLHNRNAARRELESTIQMHGDFENQAGALLNRLNKTP